MRSDIEEELEEGFDELFDEELDVSNGFIIINNDDTDDVKFFQFARIIDDDFEGVKRDLELDFPTDPNDNTKEELEKIESVVEDYPKTGDIQDRGVGIGVEVPSDIDPISFCKDIIDEIWPNCTNIEVEVGA